MKQLKQFVVYGVVASFTKLMPLLLLPIFLDYYNTVDYGVLESLIALINILSVVGTLQVEYSYQRYFYKYRRGKYSTFTVLFFVFLVGLIVSCLVSFFSSVLSTYLFESNKYSNEVSMASLLMLSINLITLTQVYFRFTEKKRLFVGISVFQSISCILISYVLVVFKGFGIYGYLIGQFSGNLLVFLVAMTYIYPSIKVFYSHKILIKFFKQSIPFIPSRFVSSVLQFGGAIIVLFLFGSDKVAQFSLANKFALIIKVALSAYSMVLFPYVYKNENDKLLNFKLKTLQVYLLPLVFLLCLLSFGVSELYLTKFVSAEYQVAISYIPVLLLAHSTGFFREIGTVGLSISNRTDLISRSYLIAFLLYVFLFFMSQSFGLTFFVYGVFVTNFVLMMLVCYFSNSFKKLYVNLKVIFAGYTASVLTLILYF